MKQKRTNIYPLQIRLKYLEIAITTFRNTPKYKSLIIVSTDKPIALKLGSEACFCFSTTIAIVKPANAIIKSMYSTVMFIWGVIVNEMV